MGYFLYGQYSKGARTTQNTIDLKFSQFSIPLLAIFYQFAWASLICQGRYFQAFPFRKTGLALILHFVHFFYTCPVLLSNASRIYTFSRLGDAKFPKTYRWLHDNKFMNLLGDLFSQLVKLQWLEGKFFSLYINDIYRLTFNKSLVNIRLIVISRR